MFMLRKKIAVISMTLAGVAVTPMVSLASATGYEYWGGITANIGGQSVGIPGGQLTHTINGKGYHVNWSSAHFLSGGNICDPSVRFTYGYGALRIDGHIEPGCSREGLWRYDNVGKVPRGNACAELWAKEWRVLVARQCHYVHD